MSSSAVTTARAAADAAVTALQEAKGAVDALHAEQARLQAELAHVRVRLALGVRALAVAQRKADAATKLLAEAAAEAEGRADRDDAQGGGTDENTESSSSDTSDSEDDQDTGEAGTAGQLAPVLVQSTVAAPPSPAPTIAQQAPVVQEGEDGSAGAQEAPARPVGPVAAPTAPAEVRALLPEGAGEPPRPPPAQNVNTRRPWTRTPDTWCKGCLYRVCAMPGGRAHDPPGLGRCLQELPEGTPHPPLPAGFVAAPPAKRGRPPRKCAA